MKSVERINEITTALDAMTAAAADGASVDLGGLDTEVEAAMTAATAEPEAERPALRQAMADLIAALDRLAVMLARQHHAAVQRRAAAAYASAASRTPGADDVTPAP